MSRLRPCIRTARVSSQPADLLVTELLYRNLQFSHFLDGKHGLESGQRVGSHGLTA